MKIDDQGTIVLFITENEVERKWLEDNTQNEGWQWLGNNLAVDHRMAQELFDAVIEQGFVKLAVQEVS